jgi:GTP-binding protein HflX
MSSIIQDRRTPDSAYFIGKGKAAEIKSIIDDQAIDIVIFDDDLSPAQVKNLELLFEVKVIDRSGLILDIFAAHARTKEAKTQVELAQLEYFLPRLTRQWSHLSRQVGGIGTKGPGETQLETDRRLIRSRIDYLKNSLKNIINQKTVQRKNANECIRLALVGYTNSGKSTLLNALTSANTYVADQLFATLDTTVRRMDYGGSTILISDTVGFIRKLPHELIVSFNTTLAQTIESDLLLHVVDVADPDYEEKINVVNQILKELNITSIPILIVMNKVDKIKNTSLLTHVKRKYPEACFISASKSIRIDNLKQSIFKRLSDSFHDVSIKMTYRAESKLRSSLTPLGRILSYDSDETGSVIEFRYQEKVKDEVQRVLQKFKGDISFEIK